MKAPIFIYVTVPTKEVGVTIATQLLEKKLIACANVFPITSLYRWEGRGAQEPEQAMLLKTFEEVYMRVEQEIKLLHPYQVPAILKFPVVPNASFLTWMAGEVVE